MLIVGVDLGKRKSHVVVIDEQGEELVSVSLKNDRDTFHGFLRRLRSKCVVVCETCINTYWLVDLLDELSIPVEVGHALRIELIGKSRRKTDKIDARVLADLYRSGFFPSIYLPPKEIRDCRDLLRGRISLKRDAARMKNRVHGVLTKAGVNYPRGMIRSAQLGLFLEGVDLPAGSKSIARRYVHYAELLDEEVKAIEKEIRQRVRLDAEWDRRVKSLESIPGIGRFGSLLLLLELVDLSRFSSKKKLWAYVGLAPSTRQTGESLRGGKLTKQGNSRVRWLLLQAAWTAVRCDPYYATLYERHRRTKMPTRAIIPVARAILTAARRVWIEEKKYQEIYPTSKAG